MNLIEVGNKTDGSLKKVAPDPHGRRRGRGKNYEVPGTFGKEPKVSGRGEEVALRKVEVALLITHPDQLTHILDDLEKEGKNSKFYGISLALHFSSGNKPTLYRHGKVEVPAGSRLDQYEGYMGTLNLYRIREALKKELIKEVEIHLPDFETLADKNVSLSPCDINNHRMLWDRYIFLRKFFSDVKGRIIITENASFIKRDGKRMKVGGKEITRDEALLADLRYRAGLRGIENWFNRPMLIRDMSALFAGSKEQGYVRHAFEHMPGDTVASETISLPEERTIADSMHGSPLMDIAHWQLSATGYRGLDKDKFCEQIDRLISILKTEEKYTDMSDLRDVLIKRKIGVIGVAVITKPAKRVIRHLEKLKELPQKIEERLQERLRETNAKELTGADMFILVVGTAKELAKTDKENVVPAVHGVCARRTYDETRKMTEVEEVVKVYKNDVPLLYVLNSDVSGLTKAVMEMNGDIARDEAYQLSVKLIRIGLEALKAIFDDNPDVPKLIVDEVRYAKPRGHHVTIQERWMADKIEGLGALRKALLNVDFKQALENFELEHPIGNAA